MSLRQRCDATILGLAAIGLALLGSEARAQASESAPSSPASTAAAPNPYYVGVSEALTHDSNVYRIQGGPSDNYSSTSVLGGFDQRIGRQRVFGRAGVTASRYQDQDQLNNVSCNLNAGLDWETIERLSGNINVGLARSLATPAASASAPVQSRNIAQVGSVDARARWGGASLLTLEGGLQYSNLDYSDPTYQASESSRTGASLGLYYHPGGPLRLGIAARVDRTKTPRAFVDPVTGEVLSTRLNGRNLDLLADYDLTGLITANARVSYTRQTNSGIANADFSGLTGSLGVNWRPTGKTTVRFDAARDAGFNASAYNTFVFNPGPSGLVLTPVVGLYENNQVTNSAGVSIGYAATAKISANASARYLRARLTVVNATGTSPDVVDISKIVSLGANYEITRAWGLACNLGHEVREVSGGTAFSYSVNTVGCSTQFTWR